MTASVQNAASRRQKVGGQVSLSGDQTELKKSTGAAVTAWLRMTYRPVIEENPIPAFVFMVCFLGTMLEFFS
jgi:hypothetical protein